MKVTRMENNSNLNKLAYQKPEIEILELSDSINADPTAGNDGLAAGLFS